MRSLTRNMAVVASTAVIATMGVGGVVAAQAGTSSSPDSSSVQKSDTGETEEASDGPDKGPDANASEPGHQDADESGEAEGADEAGESEGVDEKSDGPDKGPDANASEPGHQDADESGESN